jgi:hypothetical protein
MQNSKNYGFLFNIQFVVILHYYFLSACVCLNFKDNYFNDVLKNGWEK